MNQRKRAKLVQELKKSLFSTGSAKDLREFEPCIGPGKEIHHKDQSDGSVRLMFEGHSVMATVKITVEQIE